MDRETVDLTLLANFTHQVINPLNGAAGILLNLHDGIITDPNRAKQRLGAARAQLEHSITLIRNLAFMASGFPQLKEAETKVVVLPQSIIEAAQFFQELGARRNIKIDLSNRHSQNKIKGQPDLVRQVFMNLFDNAVKYSQTGSTVQVKQWVQKQSGDALVSIVSTPDHQIHDLDFNKMFQLGFRGENAKKRIASGTGLGLHICSAIVSEVHNGSIVASRHEGNKIEFLVRFPGALND